MSFTPQSAQKKETMNDKENCMRRLCRCVCNECEPPCEMGSAEPCEKESKDSLTANNDSEQSDSEQSYSEESEDSDEEYDEDANETRWFCKGDPDNIDQKRDPCWCFVCYCHHQYPPDVVEHDEEWWSNCTGTKDVDCLCNWCIRWANCIGSGGIEDCRCAWCLHVDDAPVDTCLCKWCRRWTNCNCTDDVDFCCTWCLHVDDAPLDTCICNWCELFNGDPHGEFCLCKECCHTYSDSLGEENVPNVLDTEEDLTCDGNPFELCENMHTCSKCRYLTTEEDSDCGGPPFEMCGNIHTCPTCRCLAYF